MDRLLLKKDNVLFKGNMEVLVVSHLLFLPLINRYIK